MPISTTVAIPPTPPNLYALGLCTGQVLVQINRKAIQNHLSVQIGADAMRPLTLTGALDMTTKPGAALRRLVMHLVAEADTGIASIGNTLWAKRFEGRSWWACWRRIAKTIDVSLMRATVGGTLQSA